MELQFEYVRREVLQALRYHFIRKPEIRVMLILVNVFALLSAALFAFGLASPMPFLMGSVLWLSMMSAVWFWMPAAVYRRNRTFTDRFRVRLGPGHVFIETRGGQHSWAWREFSGYFETPAFLHLCRGPRGFFLLPKSAMGGVEGVSRARAILAERLPKA